MVQKDTMIGNTFQMLGWRLNHVGHALKTAALNMENLRTPGYKEQELTPFAQTLHGRSLALQKTHPGHLSAPSVYEGGFKTRDSPETETDFTGNNVNLRTQLMRANQSGLDHSQMTNLYRASSEIVEMALLKK